MIKSDCVNTYPSQLLIQQAQDKKQCCSCDVHVIFTFLFLIKISSHRYAKPIGHKDFSSVLLLTRKLAEGKHF